MLLSLGESDERPDAAEVPHPCQDAAQVIVYHLQLK